MFFLWLWLKSDFRCWHLLQGPLFAIRHIFMMIELSSGPVGLKTMWWVIVSAWDCYSNWLLKYNFVKLAELEHMQPTAAANLPPPGGDMDIQTMQSMDWLFKKERIYLLAQFWQQVGGKCLLLAQCFFVTTSWKLSIFRVIKSSSCSVSKQL